MSLTLAETAERTGLTAHTLRYYEHDGLMLTADRSASGHRRYTERDLDWIRLVTRLRSTGMPIRDVRRYADLVRQGPGNEAQRRDSLCRHWVRCAPASTRVSASSPPDPAGPGLTWSALQGVDSAA